MRGELFSIVVSDCFDAVSERQKHACAGLHDRVRVWTGQITFHDSTSIVPQTLERRPLRCHEPRFGAIGFREQPLESLPVWAVVVDDVRSQADLFPYRIEYRRLETPQAASRDGPPIPYQLNVDPMIVLEFSDVTFDAPISAGQFDYMPGDADWVNQTAALSKGSATSGSKWQHAMAATTNLAVPLIGRALPRR